MSLIGGILRFFLERRVKDKIYDELINELQKGEVVMIERLSRVADTPRNREVAAHIIGMERWSQRRLRTALNGPLVMDESDAHYPDRTLDLPALREQFQATRSASVALAQQLQQAGVDKRKTVRHNDAGDLTVGAWLGYLSGHANLELRGLK